MLLFNSFQIFFYVTLVQDAKVYHLAHVRQLIRLHLHTRTHIHTYVHTNRPIHSRHDIVESASGAVEKRRKKITRPPNISDSNRAEE